MLLLVDNYGINWPEYDAVLPVPLHPTRLRERRFNQVLLLLAQMPQYDLPVQSEWLLRVRNTLPQAELSAKQRRENVKNAFAVAPGIKLDNQRILLVDDVASTGSTLHECAKACKDAGAEIVDAAVVARATLW